MFAAMTKAIAMTQQYALQSHGLLRPAIVSICALALIAAGQAFPALV